MTSPPADASASPPATGPLYFTVSGDKLAILSVASFGLYQVYWFYRNWTFSRDHGGRGRWPLPRAVLAPVLSLSLFREMRATLRQHALPGVPAGLLAALYFALSASALLLPDPWWLTGLLSFAPLLVVQALVNRLHARVAPAAPRNTRYSLGNVALIVLGAVLWFLVFLCRFGSAAVPPGMW